MYTMNFQNVAGKLTLSARHKDLIMDVLVGANPKLFEILEDKEIISCERTLGDPKEKAEWQQIVNNLGRY